MQVGDEDTRELLHVDSRLRGAAHHAGAAIHKIDAVAGDDCDRRTHAVGLRIGRAGAQQDDARILRRKRRQVDER